MINMKLLNFFFFLGITNLIKCNVNLSRLEQAHFNELLDLNQVHPIPYGYVHPNLDSSTLQIYIF